MVSTQKLTDEDLQTRGWNALVERLGIVDAVRFIMRERQSKGNYLEDIQDSIWGDMTVEEIHEDAAAFERQHPELLEGKEIV